MNDTIIFGDKTSFAIELGYSKHPKKFLLRFWIKNLPMGTFEKPGELNFSIDTFRKIVQKKESMYLPVFDEKTAAEIYDYTIIDHDKEEDFERLEMLVPLYKLAFFGKQFSHRQSFHLVIYRNDILWFLWKNDFDKPLYEAKVPFDEFCKVFNQYIEYCTQKKIV